MQARCCCCRSCPACSKGRHRKSLNPTTSPRPQPSTHTPPVAPSPQTQRQTPPATQRQIGPLEQQARQIHPAVSMEYDLNRPLPSSKGLPTATVEIKTYGILVMKTHQTNVTYNLMNWKEHELQVQREMNHAFGTLMSDQPRDL